MDDTAPPAAGGSLPAAPSEAARPVAALSYDGMAGDLGKIAISNALLTLATLGVYRFWGKTRIRRYLWSRLSFLNDRLEYSGTGKELFVGFLIALAILFPLVGTVVAVQVFYPEDLGLQGTAQSLQAVIILFLVHVAIYRARRYRLTRTQWRGIRFGQDGSSAQYALRAFGWGIVMIVTLGLAYVVYRVRLQHFRTEHTWFGDRRLAFDGQAGDLFGAWLLTWLLLIPTFGLIYVWYRVKELRYFAERTSCGALGFKSELSTGSVFVVFIIYYAVMGVVLFLIAMLAGTLMSLVLGGGPSIGEVEGAAALGAAAEGAAELWMVGAGFAIFAAIAVVFGVLQVLLFLHPLFRIVARSVSVIGEEDYAAIAQNQQAVPGRGEGLADALDVSPF